jgi:biopolymer transport protein TolQ
MRAMSGVGGRMFWGTTILLTVANVATPIQQQSILALVSQSGPVVQSVLYLLLAFSIVSWGIILYKFGQVRQARKESRRFNDLFWETKNLSSVYTASMDMKAGAVAQVFRSGYQELMRFTRGRKQQTNPGPSETTDEEGGIDNVERAMRRAMREQITRLERGLTFLATTGSTTPFVGLFGTVWGIMNAFRGLALAQSTSIQAVAPGIAEALVATAVGLAAAIPAVMGYNYFSRQVRVLASEMENFSAEFLNIAERHFL